MTTPKTQVREAHSEHQLVLAELIRVTGDCMGYAAYMSDKAPLHLFRIS